MPLPPVFRANCTATVPTQGVAHHAARGRVASGTARTQPVAPCIAAWVIPVHLDAGKHCTLPEDWRQGTQEFTLAQLTDTNPAITTLRCKVEVDFTGQPPFAAVMVLFMCSKVRVREFNHGIELSEAALKRLGADFPQDRIVVPDDSPLRLRAGLPQATPSDEQMQEAVRTAVRDQHKSPLHDALLLQPRHA